MTIPFNITAGSLTFFAKGRPWEVPSDHSNFATIRHLLQSGDADREQLVELADVRVPIIKASEGKLEFVGDELVYNGQVLHNVWVEKILQFKDANEPFAPVFNALEDLLKNPTPAAIERLPIFVEQTKLGFLPDGRITGFKGVREDYLDLHSRTFHNTVGAKLAIERRLVDPDPDRTCSTGLHVGALPYVREFIPGSGRIMLVAFWPRDAVAVPTDYNGSKLRVCAYEVLDELDKDYVDEFLGRNQTVVRGYTSEVPPAPPAWQTAVVGDKVALSDLSSYDFEHNPVSVIAIDPDEGSDTRLKVQDEGLKKAWVENEDVDKIVTNHPAYLAVEGDRVRIEGDIELVDGVYEVTGVDPGDLIARLQVEGGDWVADSSVKDVIRDGKSILPQPDTDDPAAFQRANLGDHVRLAGHIALADGWYEVSQVSTYEDPKQRLQVRGPSGNWWVYNDSVKAVR